MTFAIGGHDIVSTVSIHPVEIGLCRLPFVKARAKEEAATARGPPQVVDTEDEVVEVGGGATEDVEGLVPVLRVGVRFKETEVETERSEISRLPVALSLHGHGAQSEDNSDPGKDVDSIGFHVASFCPAEAARRTLSGK